MSYYRNLDKVVSSQLFKKPNHFLLQSRFRPVYLEVNGEPRIEYLHSLKSLIKTIQEFENHSKSQTNYTPAIQQELQFLNSHKESYSKTVDSYVSKGGLLTGEGIANLYYSAERLNLSAEWLEKNIHHEIPSKFRFMSKVNLEDTIQGLNKYHKESPYLQLLKEELAKKEAGSPSYVVHQYCETNKYEQGEDSPSNNVLLSSIKAGRPLWLHNILLSFSFIQKTKENRGKYTLHSA